MYAAIRRYQVDPQLAPEVIRPILERFVPLIRDTVIAYYVLDAGDGEVVTISICEDEAKVESTNRTAADWMKHFIASSVVSRDSGLR